MRTIRLLLVIAFLFPFFAGNARKGDMEKNMNGKIEVYYFHFTARCMTCRTVEERAKENLEDLYPDLMKTGMITFQAVNMDEEAGEALSKKMGVSGQTLLLVKGAEKINLTNEAFLYAVTNPEKYKAIIKEKVDKLLK